MSKTPGQIAYEQDVALTPTYVDGRPRVLGRWGMTRPFCHGFTAAKPDPARESVHTRTTIDGHDPSKVRCDGENQTIPARLREIARQLTVIDSDDRMSGYKITRAHRIAELATIAAELEGEARPPAQRTVAAIPHPIATASTEADLARDIRVGHAELRAAENRAVLARDNVGQARELARTARLLVDVGRDPPLRQLRAEALLAEAQAEEARAFGELLAARRLLLRAAPAVPWPAAAPPSLPSPLPSEQRQETCVSLYAVQVVPVRHAALLHCTPPPECQSIGK